MPHRAVIDFAEYMLSHSQFLFKDSSHDELEEFRDIQQPLPLSMLGYFGNIIAIHYAKMTDEEWHFLSDCIEKGLTCKDDDVNAAFATGLIESLVNQAERFDGLWPIIQARLGPAARSYADYYDSIDYDLPYRKNPSL